MEWPRRAARSRSAASNDSDMLRTWMAGTHNMVALSLSPGKARTTRQVGSPEGMKTRFVECCCCFAAGEESGLCDARGGSKPADPTPLPLSLRGCRGRRRRGCEAAQAVALL